MKDTVSSFLLIGLLVASTLVPAFGVFYVADGVSASSPTLSYSETVLSEDLVGYIECLYNDSTGTDSTTVYLDDGKIRFFMDFDGDSNWTDYDAQTYVKFNLSSLPEEAAVDSISLRFDVDDFSSSGYVLPYLGEYGDSLNASDWDCGRDNGTYAGIGSTPESGAFVNSTGGYSIPLDISKLNLTGMNEFELTPSYEKPMDEYPWDGGCFEIVIDGYTDGNDHRYESVSLEIEYHVAVSIEYELHDGSSVSTELYPMVSELNRTHDLLTMELDTWDDVDNISVSKVFPTWEFLNCTPYANSTSETDEHINLTGVVTGVTYRVYVAAPRDRESLIHLSLYNEYSGRGLSISDFNVRYAPVPYADEDSTMIVSSEFSVSVSEGPYLIVVFDYFDREIAHQYFEASDEVLAVSIGLSITEVYLQFSDSRSHDFAIGSGGGVVNFSASPMSLVSTYDYDLTVYEDQYIEENSTTLPVFSGASDLLHINVTLKNEPAELHFRYYDATGTHPGAGVAWESYPLYVDDEFSPFPWVNTVINASHEVVVLDYFDNELYNETVTVDEADELLEIPINTYSFKVMNGQVFNPVKCEIYFNDSGDWVGPHAFYSGPGEVVERFLTNGSYRVLLTYYSDTDLPNGTVYFYYNITGDSSYLCVRENGTVYELTVDISGYLEYNELITTLLTPDVLHIGENLPTIPNDMDDADCILVHPYSIVSGTRHYPNGTTEDFRNSSIFYYSYYTTRKYYEVTLTLNNSEEYNWTDVTWFVGFPENSSISYPSVRVYDLDNAVYMSLGRNYDMTLAGIRMHWDYFNASLNRSFTFTFYAENRTEGMGTAIAYVDTYESTELEGEDYLYSLASWTNPYAAEYNGELYIRVDHEYGRYLDPGSIIIRDNLLSEQLSVTDWTYQGNTIVISYIEAGIGQVYSFDVYYQVDYSEAGGFDLFSPILVIGGVGLSPAIFMGIACAGMVAWTASDYSDRKFILLLIMCSITIVLIMLSWIMGGA